jgi:ElaB/YqjD/DUF883 family membrane-anchored ribosome-binding protein
MVRGNGTNPVGGEGVPEGLLSSPQARERVRASASELVERMRGVPEAVNRANDTFVRFVREQPLVALGAACALGYVLGRALRRVV